MHVLHSISLTELSRMIICFAGIWYECGSAFMHVYLPLSVPTFDCSLELWRFWCLFLCCSSVVTRVIVRAASWNQKSISCFFLSANNAHTLACLCLYYICDRMLACSGMQKLYIFVFSWFIWLLACSEIIFIAPTGTQHDTTVLAWKIVTTDL
jgi:hypothetical protein